MNDEINLIYTEKFKNIEDRIKDLQKKMDDEDTAKILIKLQVLHDVGQEDAKKTELRAEKRDIVMENINNNINKLGNILDSTVNKILNMENEIKILKSKFEIFDNKTKIDTSVWPKAGFGFICVAVTTLIILLVQKLLKL